MNIGEAISKLEHINWRYCTGNYDVAMRMAINALRTQQETEKNEPLTLDEMRQMDGEPVWIEFLSPTDTCPGHWRIWRTSEYDDYALNAIGRVWNAYRRKPQED